MNWEEVHCVTNPLVISLVNFVCDSGNVSGWVQDTNLPQA